MVDFVTAIGPELFREQFAGSPAMIAFLDAIFRDADPSVHSTLLECADESDFSLRQWVEALRTLGHWLDAHGLELSFEDQIGYVCCAAESARSGANLSHLPSLVDEMLETYGCERAVKK